MSEVISWVRLHPEKGKAVFSREQVVQLLPLVSKITKEAKIFADALINEMACTPDHDLSRMAMIDQELEKTVSTWESKMERLGLVITGLWKLSFPAIGGFYSWHFPKSGIDFSESKDLELISSECDNENSFVDSLKFESDQFSMSETRNDLRKGRLKEKV